VLRTSSGLQKQPLGVHAGWSGLDTCITLRTEIITKSNKLLQIVTLRQNNARLGHYAHSYFSLLSYTFELLAYFLTLQNKLFFCGETVAVVTVNIFTQQMLHFCYLCTMLMGNSITYRHIKNFYTLFMY